MRENISSTKKSLNTAKKICKKLNIPYYIFDVRFDFKKEVIDYFVSEIKNNKTPNPCIICNRYLKFKKLFEFGEKIGAKYVATGHYAKIEFNPKTKKYQLLKAKDKNKDQTYFLSFLPQKWLKYIIFPLGNYSKKEVYQMAKKKDFDFFQKQSQDFCFVAGKSLSYFLEKKIGEKPGKILNTKGNILGEHQGLHFYTIGQRKRIKMAEGPYYVLKKDIKNNTLLVTKNEKDLDKKELIVKNVNWISGKIPRLPLRIKAKIRYRHKAASTTIYRLKTKNYKLIFDSFQRAVTPGQFAVFYLKNVCLGGGRII